MKLYNVRLLVNDFPAAFRFWRDVMHLPVAYGPDTPGAPAGYAYFNVDNAGVELLERSAFATVLGETMPMSMPVGHQAVLVFQVDDVDVTYAGLIERGAKPITKPVDRPEWGARTAHVSDPDGHLIEIYSPLPPSSVPTA